VVSWPCGRGSPTTSTAAMRDRSAPAARSRAST
jgi:hypothetical protein